MRSKRTDFTFVFDLDDTLIGTNVVNNNSYRDAIRKVADIDVVISSEQRFTRENLSSILKGLPEDQISAIISEKEKIFFQNIDASILNKDLCAILRILYLCGNETILLTNSRKTRAMQLCSYYSLSKYFHKQYYFEDCHQNKYQLLSDKGYDLNNIILFENDPAATQLAIKNGISKENVVKILFN